MKIPRVEIFEIFPVHGLFGSASGINSFLFPKTPRIEGENLKYSIYKSIPKPISKFEVFFNSLNLPAELSSGESELLDKFKSAETPPRR